MAQINKLMFREYDLRGRVNEEEINERTEELLGKGFGTYVKKHNLSDKVVVGHDFREYSERLQKAFIKGVLSTGLDVVNIGMCLSPMLYYAQYHFKIPAGAMITASHNENGWSGVKFAQGYSQTFLGDELQELYKIIAEDDFIEGEKEGQVTEDSVTEAYYKVITDKIKLEKPLKVVVQGGNGTAGVFAPEVIKRIGCEVVELDCELDATFPNYNPDPENMKAKEALIAKVKEVGADIGVGCDGDGDRLGVVDEKGNNIWSDRVCILLARQALEKNPGGKIVFDVKCTQALPEDVEAHGGVPFMWKTGHSYIKQKTQELGAVFGGERSGHFFIADDWYGFDDAIFAASRLIEYIGKLDRPFSEILATTPHYEISPTYHIECADEVKYDIVEKLTNELKEEYGEENVIDVNGARVTIGDGWGLVRASSNIPSLVVVMEAQTKEHLKEIERIFREKLGKYEEISKEWH